MTFANHPHLAPGTHVMERDPVTGQLVPTKKILTPDPPRPAHVSLTGKITDLTRQDVDYARDVVQEHYESRARIRGSDTMVKKEAIRELVDRAADAVMRSSA